MLLVVLGVPVPWWSWWSGLGGLRGLGGPAGQESGSVGAKTCLLTTWPLCRGLKLSLLHKKCQQGSVYILKIRGPARPFKYTVGTGILDDLRGRLLWPGHRIFKSFTVQLAGFDPSTVGVRCAKSSLSATFSKSCTCWLVVTTTPALAWETWS